MRSYVKYNFLCPYDLIQCGKYLKYVLLHPGWVAWLEHHPVHQRVVNAIPGQGTYLGSRFDPQSGHVQQTTDRCFFHIDVSLSLPLLLTLSLSSLLKSINIPLGEDFFSLCCLIGLHNKLNFVCICVWTLNL